MEKLSIRKKVVDLFGAHQAADAMMAIESFQDALALPDGAPYPDFESEEAQNALAVMSDTLHSYGYESVYQFEACIARWVDSQQGKLPPAEKLVRSSYDPVNLGSAYHDGHLYYPVKTLLRTVVASAGMGAREAERVDIVVVRSDRTLQQVEESLDEKGMPSGIFRLSDGTLLEKRPTASAHTTWSWACIQDYLNRQYTDKPLSMMAVQMHQHLRSRVWLPNEADYWMLTLAAITSYLQPVFEAVPLILLHGQSGTGKSELGAAMTEISCNAVMIGQSSASTMLRLMDEARGLVVIDDLESIGVTTGSVVKEKFSEMVQILKVSYKKASATKIVTNTRRKTEIMNFFGVKIVSNTKGVDAILGSRMMHVSTQEMGPDAIDEFLSRKGLGTKELTDLKNDLHIWAFDHVQEVDAIYQREVAGSTARDEEIAAPLNVLARLIDVPGVQDFLADSLGQQKVKKVVFKTPEHALDHIMEKMALDGMRSFTLIEISLRMRVALGTANFTRKDKPMWAKPEWISKRLRTEGWMGEELKRKNLFGYQTKVFSFSEIKRVERGLVGEQKGKPFDFCAGCGQCPYRQMHCDILPYRAKREML